MTFTFKLSRRLALIFAAVTGGALVGCSIDDPSGAIPFVPAPPSALGDTLFSDGFESGVLAWDDNFNAQAKQIITAAARTGTRGLRVTFSATSGGGNLSKFITPGDRVHVRAAVRFPSNWTGAAGLLTLRAAPAANPWAGFGVAGVCPTGSTWAATGVTTTAPNLDLRFNTQYVGMPTVSAGRCLAGPGLTGPSLATYTAPLVISKGVWHVVEIEAQLNTVGSANGWQRMWLDGVLTGEWTGLTFRTASGVQWNAVSLEMPASGVTQSQFVDIDDVLVQRQRIAPVAPVASVQVAPTTVTINAGATASLTATVRDANGATLTGRVVTWSSSQSSVATVSNSGVVTGVAAGTATITATSEGQSGTATVTVPSAPAPEALFTESFDNSSFAGRGWYDFTGTPVVSTADKHSGTGSLLWQWTAGATSPPMRVMRKLFTPTDRLYVTYWVKYSTNYVGSGKSYHPHEFNILSNQDQDWDGLTFNYLNTYIEQNYQGGGVPRIIIQDSRMIDASRIGVDLTSVTEQRSLAGCNGNSDGTGSPSCYQQSASQWYNARTWDAAAVAFMPNAGVDYKASWNHVEVEFQLNSVIGGIGQKDGVIRYWLNGNLKLERTNVMFRTGANPNLKFKQFLLTPYIGDGSPVAQSVWIDDLTLATARTPGTPTPQPAPVATVSVTPATASLQVGASTQLNAVLRDAAGAILGGRSVTWTSSAATVATVVNGVVTALSAGQATITAMSEGMSGSAVVTVTSVPQPTPVATVTVTPSTASLQAGATAQLSAVTRSSTGTELTGRVISWATSAAGVATVVNGLVTAVGAGQATITATSEGRSGSATITVSPSPPTGTATYPNEPAGAVVLMDYDTDFGNATNPPWGYIASNGNLSTTTDASAPVNPSKVGRVRFPSGCCNGTGPARLEHYPSLPGSWSRMYVSDWIKFDANWKPHACCQKIFEFFWSSGGDKWLLVKMDPGASGFPLTPRFTTEYAGTSPGNFGGGVSVFPDRWYQVEVILHKSGRLQMWVREKGQASRLAYDGTPPGAGTVNPGTLFWWWGYGGLGSYSGQTAYISHNHIRVSYTQ